MILQLYDIKLKDDIPTLFKVKNFNIPDANFNTPSMVTTIVRDLFHTDTLADEFTYLLTLDNAMHPLGIFELSRGSVNFCLVSMRGIFIRAILTGASSIILLHNHTSGNTSPSRDDLKTAIRLKILGNVLEIPLLDFLIIGRDSYYSMQENNFRDTLN